MSLAALREPGPEASGLTEARFEKRPLDFQRRTQMNSRIIRLTLGLVLAAVPVFLAGCGSGSGASNVGSGLQNGSVNLMVSDASTEDWATIGVKILSISLIPQNGGSNVNIYTAATPAPMINLVQLDQLGEILGNVSVPVGTYTGAVITISGN